jgi:hypothetical protein
MARALQPAGLTLHVLLALYVVLQIGLRQVAKIMARDPANLQASISVCCLPCLSLPQIGLRQVADIMARDPANRQGWLDPL